MKVYARCIEGNARLHDELTHKLYKGLEGVLGEYLRNKIKMRGVSEKSAGYMYECADGGCIAVLSAQYYSTITSKPTNGFVTVKTLSLQKDASKKLDALIKELDFTELNPLDKEDKHAFEYL